MSFNFNKHNPKSFVVRGDIIENLKTRQQLVSNLSGKCVYNTRLKFGSGLLVPINEKNETVLNEYKNKDFEEKIPQSVIVPYEGPESKVETDIFEEQSIDDLLLRIINSSDNEEDKEEIKEEISISLQHDEKNQNKDLKIKNSKNNNKNQKNQNKMSSERKSVNRNDKKDLRDNRDPRSSSKDLRNKDQRDDRRDDKREERRDDRRDDKREDSRDNRSRRARRESSDNDSDSYSSDSDYSSSESSDYSGDSSEDERIQETIRRKGQRPDRKMMELANSDVDSDHEDIVTLSRRVRYLVRKVKSIEDYLRK